MDGENRQLLSEMGKVILLEASLDIIEERLRNDLNRPLIKDRKNIKKLLEERKGVYDFAELKINTTFGNPNEIAYEIIRKENIKTRVLG